MNKYLNDITTIIRDGSMDNSYHSYLFQLTQKNSKLCKFENT